MQPQYNLDRKEHVYTTFMAPSGGLRCIRIPTDPTKHKRAIALLKLYGAIGIKEWASKMTPAFPAMGIKFEDSPRQAKLYYDGRLLQDRSYSTLDAR